jgi:hypothetical protein
VLVIRQESAMNDLFELIAALQKDIPFTQRRVSETIGAPLQVSVNSGPVIFYEGGPAHLSDGTIVQNIELRMDKMDRNYPGFIVLSISGKCVTFNELSKHYNKLYISAPPRGRSSDEKTMYSQEMAWGLISFGFSADNPDCASMVVIDPK